MSLRGTLWPSDISEDVTDRLKAKVKVLPNGCWEWLGYAKVLAYNGRRYPIISVNGAPRPTQMVAWLMIHDTPAPSHVMQTCGFDFCVNPDHQAIRQDPFAKAKI
jgi:hypothetical protein